MYQRTLKALAAVEAEEASSPTFVELLNEISPLVSALRIMQNLLLPMIGKAKKLGSMPSSLAAGMKKIDRYGFGDDLCAILEEYRNSGGKDIKGYRDIDQHFYTIVEHSFLQIDPTEQVLIYLPDNPEETSTARVAFANERNALPYFQHAFMGIHDCVEKIGSVLGFQPEPLGQAVSMSQLGLLTENVKKTLALIVEETATYSGLEFFQSEDRAILMRAVPKLAHRFVSRREQRTVRGHEAHGPTGAFGSYKGTTWKMTLTLSNGVTDCSRRTEI